MNDFGDEVGRLRTERGLCLHELVRRSHYDVGYLSKVSSGRKRGSHELALRLDNLLGADGQLVAAWDATSRSPVPASPLASIAPPTLTCTTGSPGPPTMRRELICPLSNG